MASRAAPVELDFLGLRGNAAAEHHIINSGGGAGASSSSSSSSSIRGMETSTIARIDPQLLRRVVVARPPPAAPATGESPAAPMTVFYNGSLAIFDVSHTKAEAILRMAADVNERGRRNTTLVGAYLSRDIPLARTKSVQQFLLKRKERLTRLGPYEMRDDGARMVVSAAATTGSKHSLRLRVKEEEAAEEDA